MCVQRGLKSLVMVCLEMIGKDYLRKVSLPIVVSLSTVLVHHGCMEINRPKTDKVRGWDFRSFLIGLHQREK